MGLLKIIEETDQLISSKLRITSRNSALFKTAAFLAHTGDSWIWCGILFIIWLFSSGENEKTIAYWGGSIAVTACIVFVIKRLIARTRPAGEWGNIYRKADPYSFPSGHSVRAGMLVMLAFHTFHDPIILFFFTIWAILMCLSRVATGVHYFMDIIAGFILGLFIGWGWVRLQPFIYQKFSVLFEKSQWFK